MKYNLQFFADADVSEEPVTSLSEGMDDDFDEAEDSGLDEETDYFSDDFDQPEGESDVDDVVEEEKHVQTPEENAKYAAARREAEAQLRPYTELDKMVAEEFGNYTNPLTGKPVSSAQEYFETLRAMRSAKVRQQVEQAGFDSSAIDELIEHNPTVMQAKQVMARQQAMEQYRALEEEVAKIHAIDPSINTPEDLKNIENFAEFDDYFQRGYSIYDAYRLANFDKIRKTDFAAAKQSAINQAKSTSHLESTNGLSAVGKELVDIPRNELATWRSYYPELSAKELKAKYNQMLNK